MKTEYSPQLILEPLEPRRLLSATWKGTDIDGDAVRVRLSGPGDMVVETTPVDDGLWIDSITVTHTSRASSLTVVAAKRRGGDGFADVGFIDAEGQPLRQIRVDGYLDKLTVGQLKNVTVLGTVDDGEFISDWFIDSDLNHLDVKYHLQNADVEITGDVRNVTIRGDLANTNLLIDGELRRMQVRRDVVDSLVSVQDRIDRVDVRGWLINSEVETDDFLNRMHVYYDIVESNVYASGDINRLIVNGGVINSTIESQAFINVIDVWDNIEDSQIIAGPQGIGTIWAWDMIDSTIDTEGVVRNINLDAY